MNNNSFNLKLLDFREAVNQSPECEGVAVIYTKNPCCETRAVIISVDKNQGRPIYSAQCACGRMHTSGFTSASAALRAWEKAAKDKEPNLCNRSRRCEHGLL